MCVRRMSPVHQGSKDLPRKRTRLSIRDYIAEKFVLRGFKDDMGQTDNYLKKKALFAKFVAAILQKKAIINAKAIFLGCITVQHAADEHVTAHGMNSWQM